MGSCGAVGKPAAEPSPALTASMDTSIFLVACRSSGEERTSAGPVAARFPRGVRSLSGITSCMRELTDARACKICWLDCVMHSRFVLAVATTSAMGSTGMFSSVSASTPSRSPSAAARAMELEAEEALSFHCCSASLSRTRYSSRSCNCFCSCVVSFPM